MSFPFTEKTTVCYKNLNPKLNHIETSLLRIKTKFKIDTSSLHYVINKH